MTTRTSFREASLRERAEARVALGLAPDLSRCGRGDENREHVPDDGDQREERYGDRGAPDEEGGAARRGPAP